MELNILLETLSAIGLPGLVAAAGILFTIFVAKRAGLVVTGDQARLANILLAAITFGMSDNPQAEAALMAVLASVLSALAHEGLEWTGKYLSDESGKIRAQMKE